MIVIGGTASYGPGAYAGTPLEDALPVTVKVTDGRERQRVALLLIIDKSGSMGYDPSNGRGKIEMAKEAARLAAGALAPGDDPLKIGNTSLLAFSPMGSATGGTLYVAAHRGPQMAIRVFGATGRVRVLMFDAPTQQWHP